MTVESLNQKSFPTAFADLQQAPPRCPSHTSSKVVANFVRNIVSSLSPDRDQHLHHHAPPSLSSSPPYLSLHYQFYPFFFCSFFFFISDSLHPKHLFFTFSVRVCRVAWVGEVSIGLLGLAFPDSNSNTNRSIRFLLQSNRTDPTTRTNPIFSGWVESGCSGLSDPCPPRLIGHPSPYLGDSQA